MMPKGGQKTPQWDPKELTKRFEIEALPGTPLGSQNGRKMEPKWNQNGSKMEPKWIANGAKMNENRIQNNAKLNQN